MQTSNRLVFFGNERLSTAFTPPGAPTLEALIANGYDIAAVVARFEPGTSRKKRALEIEEVAGRHNIPVLLPEKLSEIKDRLQTFHPTAGILIAYGKIIPPWLIELFPKGIINIHPSLLPAYRGSTPIEQAMLDGIAQTGVSLMQLTAEMDAGPVYAQDVIPLYGNEQKQVLTQKLLGAGSKLLITHLPAILNGSLSPQPQDPKKATYCRTLSKQDGVMDWSKPAQQLEREVRAFAGWPQSKAAFKTVSGDNFEAIITEAKVDESNDSLSSGLAQVQENRLLIGTSKDHLEVLRLKIPGKKEVSAAEFIQGYRL